MRKPEIVIAVEEVRRQAIALEKFLSRLETVYDCTGLEYDGYDETDTMVVVEGKESTVASIVCNQFGGDYDKVKEANIKIQSVSVVDRDASDCFIYGVCGATYNRIKDEFVFDVGDVNYSDKVLLKDVRLDSLDEEFSRLLDTVKLM